MPHHELKNLIAELLLEYDALSTEGDTLLHEPAVTRAEFAVFFVKVVDLGKRCDFELDDTGRLRQAHIKLREIAAELAKKVT